MATRYSGNNDPNQAGRPSGISPVPARGRRPQTVLKEMSGPDGAGGRRP